MPIEWYVRVGNTARGPISPEMLKQFAVQGKIKPDMLLRKGQSGNWIPAKRFKGLFPASVTAEAPATVARPGEASPPVAAEEATPAAAEPDAPVMVQSPRPEPVAAPDPQLDQGEAEVPSAAIPVASPMEVTRPCPSCQRSDFAGCARLPALRDGFRTRAHCAETRSQNDRREAVGDVRMGSRRQHCVGNLRDPSLVYGDDGFPRSLRKTFR